MNGFYSGWESEYCDRIHEKFGYLPPEKFRSPVQQLQYFQKEQQAMVERAKAGLYLDLCLSDILPALEPLPFPSVSLLITCKGGDGSEEVRDGNILSASVLQDEPTIELRQPLLSQQKQIGDQQMEQQLFTLVFTDPDAPSRVKHSMREFVHWVVVNIPGSDVNRGTEILSYVGPAPPFASGLHRYVFTMYRQKGVLGDQQIDGCMTYFQTRQGIRSHGWISSPEMQDLMYQTPVAIEAFLCEWEECVDAFHDAMGWTPPSPFKSDYQYSQEELPERIYNISAASCESIGTVYPNLDDQDDSTLYNVYELKEDFGSFNMEASLSNAVNISSSTYDNDDQINGRADSYAISSISHESSSTVDSWSQPIKKGELLNEHVRLHSTSVSPEKMSNAARMENLASQRNYNTSQENMQSLNSKKEPITNPVSFGSSLSSSMKSYNSSSKENLQPINLKSSSKSPDSIYTSNSIINTNGELKSCLKRSGSNSSIYSENPLLQKTHKKSVSCSIIEEMVETKESDKMNSTSPIRNGHLLHLGRNTLKTSMLKRLSGSFDTNENNAESDKKTTTDLCNIYDITSPSIFDGGK